MSSEYNDNMNKERYKFTSKYKFNTENTNAIMKPKQLQLF